MFAKTLLRQKQSKCKQHPDQSYALICLEVQCPERGIICAECQLLKHSDHLVKPLTLALKQISNDLQPIPNSIHIMSKIDQLYTSFYQGMSRLGKQRKVIQQELNKFFKNIHDRIMSYRVICSRILDEGIKGEEFNALMKRYKFYEREECDKDKTNFQIFLREILDYIAQRSQQFKALVVKRAENRQILQLLTPYESQTKLHYSFSLVNKHANINISNDGLTATQLNNYSTNFAFVQPILEGKKSLRSKRTIKFFINKLSSWLSIGCVYMSFAKKANFYFNTGSIGHGGFLLSYNGYSWHHTDSSLNSNYVTFNFAQGDTVSLTINPATKKLIYERQGQTAFELPYERIAGEQLYFCVSLSNHDESVSIVK